MPSVWVARESQDAGKGVANRGRTSFCEATEESVMRDEAEERAAEALEAEVKRRNEWYGLDNWTYSEVASFVLESADVVPRSLAVELAEAVEKLVNAGFPTDPKHCPGCQAALDAAAAALARAHEEGVIE